MTSMLERLKALQSERNLKPSGLDIRGLGRKRDLEASDKRYEREVAKSLEKGGDIAALEAQEKFQHAMDDTIAAFEREARAKNITLDQYQLRALKGGTAQQCFCLIGAAGTGKTTVTRFMMKEFVRKLVAKLNKENGEKLNAIAIACYTGRAAQQSRKAIGPEFDDITVVTMHSLLGYAPTMEEVMDYDPITKSMFPRERRVFRPTFGVSCKLPYSVYIIDEASMMPIPLFNEFIDAIHPTSRIILIGDIHQLPPVYGKSVLGYALRKWPVFELEKIHRQAEGNPIIANAHRILKGEALKKADNFFLLPSKAGGAADFSVDIRRTVNFLWQKGKYDPYRDVIIVANSDPEIMTSAPALNEHFMTLFNPEKTVNGVIINKRINIHTGTAHVYFAVGDKVMVNSNINTISPPITNGMMGIVESINVNGRYDQKRAQVDTYRDDDGDGDPVTLDMNTIHLDLETAMGKQKKKDDAKEDESMDQRQSSHVMTIKFETGQQLRCATAGDYRRISFGYAITCHKSQGGEYPNVIIAIHSANGTLLTQEWLYTAVTRAKDNVFLLHNQRGLDRAIRNQKIKGKTLAEKIQSYAIEAHADDVDLKDDPWNVDRKQFPILFNPKVVS